MDRVQVWTWITTSGYPYVQYGTFTAVDYDGTMACTLKTWRERRESGNNIDLSGLDFEIIEYSSISNNNAH